MENPKRLSTTNSKATRSGYEPSDTETEWQEDTPGDDHDKMNGDEDFQVSNTGADQARNFTSLRLGRLTAKFEQEVSSPVTSKASQGLRRHSKSPYKPQRDEGNALPLPPGRRTISPLLARPTSELRKNVSPFARTEVRNNVSPFARTEVRKNASPFAKAEIRNNASPFAKTEIRNNVSPFAKTEHRRHVSPYKPVRENHGFRTDSMGSLERKHIHRDVNDHTGRVTDKVNYSHRSASAPRPRDKDQHIKYNHVEHKKHGRTPSPLSRNPSPLARNQAPKEKETSNKNTPSVGEINEILANAKISRGLVGDAPIMDSTDSISPGDIFFSHEYGAVTMQKIIFPKNGGFEGSLSPKPQRPMENLHSPRQRNKTNGTSNLNFQRNSSSNGLTRNSSSVTSSAVSRQSSNLSDASERTNGTAMKFAVNRKKKQTDTWFPCISGSCRTSKKPPQGERAFDEASFIEKAFVVESLRQFWADKHQPASLNGFACRKHEAQLLKKLVDQDICPHILLKGPPGSGKKALTMAYLREIYGDPASNITHERRYFQVQETRSMQVSVPVTSSAHHVELNVHKEPNARYALMALIKQISSNHSVTPEISNVNFKADYTVMVLYDVDKATENIQHLIKWIMDCYTDVCKLVLCCEDDFDIIESVKTRCKIIKVDAPVTHEIMEVLLQIALKENFEIPMSFAAKISTKAKQNLRRAIMALEACKAHNYPFADDQPIPMGWEEVVVELAAEILADPTPNRLLNVRGKLQRLLVDFVHPKLILQKLIEEFLKVVGANLKRELYYWHGYYEKRLPMGTTAVLKLEEFVAKFMSIHRKSSSNN